MYILLTHLQSKQAICSYHVLSLGDRICSYNQLWSLNEWNRVSIDCVNCSSKQFLQMSQKGGLHVDDKLLDTR